MEPVDQGLTCFFEGQTIKVDTHDGGLAELRFERASEAVNKHMRQL